MHRTRWLCIAQKHAAVHKANLYVGGYNGIWCAILHQLLLNQQMTYVLVSGSKCISPDGSTPMTTAVESLVLCMQLAGDGMLD